MRTIGVILQVMSLPAICLAYLPADFDYNGIVDFNDFATFSSQWLQEGAGTRQGWGNTATFLVASKFAPAHVKAQAHFVCDGVADEVEINAAIEALPRVGTHMFGEPIGRVHLSTREFHLSSPIELRGGVTLSGDNLISTIIFYDGQNNENAIQHKAGSPALFITVRNLGLRGNKDNNTSGDAINLDGVQLVRIQNCQVDAFAGSGISLAGMYSQVVSACYVENCDQFGIKGGSEIIGCTFLGNKYGMCLAEGAKVISCQITESRGHSLYINGDGVTVMGCAISDNWQAISQDEFPPGSLGYIQWTTKPDLYSWSDKICLIGNRIKCANSNYGILIQGANSIIAANTFSGALSCSIQVESATGQIFGNQTDDANLGNLERKVATYKNTSGGPLVTGDVVVLKRVAAGNECITTTTTGDSLVLGVVAEAIANNAAGPIQTLGKTRLKVNGTRDIAIGDFLSCCMMPKIAQKAAPGHTAFAIALEAYTADDSNGAINAVLVTPRKN